MIPDEFFSSKSLNSPIRKVTWFKSCFDEIFFKKIFPVKVGLKCVHNLYLRIFFANENISEKFFFEIFHWKADNTVNQFGDG